MAYVVIAERYKMSKSDFEELSLEEIGVMYHYVMYLNNRDRETAKNKS